MNTHHLSHLIADTAIRAMVYRVSYHIPWLLLIPLALGVYWYLRRRG